VACGRKQIPLPQGEGASKGRVRGSAYCFVVVPLTWPSAILSCRERTRARHVTGTAEIALSVVPSGLCQTTGQMNLSVARFGRHSILGLIWLAFLARGLFYVSIMPMWEGFDEYAHFGFADYMSSKWKLPQPDERVSAEISRSLELAPLPWSLRDWQTPSTTSMTHDTFWLLSADERDQRVTALKAIPRDFHGQREKQYIEESKQPPLYYVLAAGIYRGLGDTDLTTRVFVLRLFGVLLASLVVPLTFMVAKEVLGRAEQALGVAALVAAMPGLFIDVSRICNDVLAIALFSILIYVLLKAESWGRYGWPLITLLLTAGLLTKAYFVAAVPAVAVAGAMSIWKTPRPRRLRRAGFIASCLALGLVLCGWWYLKSLSAGGPIWADAAPSTSMSGVALLSRAMEMPWQNAINVAWGSHIWIGGWSFLGVRSWMYQVFYWIFLVGLVGSHVRMVLQKSQSLMLLWLVFIGFWMSMLYHAFVNFINVGNPVTTGWYLYAVVTCEMTIVASGLYYLIPQRWSGAVSSLTALFVMLEAYATHFVLIPYYTGLIRHNARGTLGTFQLNQASSLGWSELLRRASINKPDFLVPSVLIVLWLVFLAASLYLLFVGFNCARNRPAGIAGA